jgi:hypothetical protein
MPIRSIRRLPGLPGEGTAGIRSYSPKRETLPHEGVAVELQDDEGVAWIGHFDAEQQASPLPPLLTARGRALVFSGPYCFVVSGRGSGDFSVIESFHSTDVWTQSRSGKELGSEFHVCGSRGGKIVAFDAFGKSTAAGLFDVCEDLAFDDLQGGVLSGRYYEFNLEEWVPFRLAVPELSEL